MRLPPTVSDGSRTSAAAGPVSLTAGPGTDRGIGSLLRRPGYGVLLAGSLLWHVNRWGSLFATTLWLTRQGATPIRIQVIVALCFAPLLLGSAAANLLARAAPRTVVLATQLALLPLQAAMVVLVALGAVPTWITAACMLGVGIGNTVNMTSQRMLIQDAAGGPDAAAALKLDPVLSGVGAMLGAFGTGVIADRLGSPAAFGVVAALGAACIVLTLCTAVPPHRRPARAGGGRPPRVLAVIRDSPGLTSMIAVTLVMNLCVFGYTSLVPKMSEQFTASAAVAGLLTAAAGLGQLIGGLLIAALPVRRRGAVLFAGSGLSIVGVMTFAVAPSPAWAFASLLVAGLGQSGFSAMQSMIAIDLPDGTVRTVALGAVSTAVGALPLGMLLIGGLSQGLGVRGGILVAAGAGGALLLAVAGTVGRPHLRRQAPALRS